MLRSEQSSDNPLLAMVFPSVFQIQRFEQQLQKTFLLRRSQSMEISGLQNKEGRRELCRQRGRKRALIEHPGGCGDVWGSRRVLVLCPWAMSMAWRGPLHPHLLADAPHSPLVVHCKCICKKDTWDERPSSRAFSNATREIKKGRQWWEQVWSVTVINEDM